MSDIPGDIHPILRQLYDYWLAKRPGDKLPGRQHFDPLDIPDLLPHLSVFDVVREGAAVRYRGRVVGTRNVDIFGRDITGQWLDEKYPRDEYDKLAVTFHEAIADREPNYLRSKLKIPNREFIAYERLLCPLAADGETVDMLFGAFVEVEEGVAG